MRSLSLSPGFVRPLLIVMAPLLAVIMPAAALACSLDGIASISVNGDLAGRATDAPTPPALARWAPFTFRQAYAAGALLRFAEDRAKLRRSLPAAALAHPFRWAFGDGGTAESAVGTHRYRRPGWYTVTVHGYWPSHRRWLAFDSARVHILPASALFWANLGYRLDRGLYLLINGLIYAGSLGVFLLAVRAGLRAWRLRRGLGA